MSNTVPKGWRIFPIGEICNIAIGGTPSRSEPAYWDSTKSSGSPWVSIRDLNKPWIYETAEYITDAGVNNSNVKLVKPGTVLMSFKLSVGRVAFAGRELYTNEAIAAFLPKNKSIYADQFLYQGLQHWNLLENIDQAVKGVTLNKEKINQIEALLPPLPEQQKIAAILSSVDDVIEKTRAQIDKLKDLKAGMMQELLTKGIGHTAFKDSPVGRIPEGWEVVSFFDAVSIQNGQVDPKESEYQNLVLVAPNHVESNSGQLLELETAKEQGAISGKFLCKPNTLIYSKIRPRLRKAALVNFECLCSADMYPMVCRKNLVPEFLKAVILDERFSSFAATVSERSNIPKINRTELAEFVFALPPFKEQIAIGNVLASLDAQIQIMSNKLKSSADLKKALMQDLLTGKVRVNVDNKENAVA